MSQKYAATEAAKVAKAKPLRTTSMDEALPGPLSATA